MFHVIIHNIKRVAPFVALATLLPATAQAQEVNFTLNAEVDPICEANSDRGDNIEIDLGILSQTPTGTEVDSDGVVDITYVCNDPDGFTRTITSLNDGVLVRIGSGGGQGNEIPYFLSSDGGNGLAFSRLQLTAPLTRSFGGSVAFLDGVLGTLTVTVNGVLEQNAGNVNGVDRTTVFAGQYTDVITLAVTAN